MLSLGNISGDFYFRLCAFLYFIYFLQWTCNQKLYYLAKRLPDTSVLICNVEDRSELSGSSLSALALMSKTVTLPLNLSWLTFALWVLHEMISKVPSHRIFHICRSPSPAHLIGVFPEPGSQQALDKYLLTLIASLHCCGFQHFISVLLLCSRRLPASTQPGCSHPILGI